MIQQNSKKILLILATALLMLTAAALSIWQLSPYRSSYAVQIIEDGYITEGQQVPVSDEKTLMISNAVGSCSSTTDCSDSTRYAFLRFSVKRLTAEPSSVRLRLYATNISADGGSVYAAASDLENSAIPQATGDPIANFGPIKSLGWHEVPLPPSIFQKEGVYSFVIKSNDRNPAAYSSKESGKSSPKLLLSSQERPKKLPSQATTVATAGDIACGEKVFMDDDCQHEETARLLDAIRPESILLLGDIQYETGLYSYFVKNFGTTWGKYKSISRPAPGNHEYYNSVGDSHPEGCDVIEKNNPYSYACGYYDYFNGKGNLEGQAGERGKGYYAFSIGNWRIYAINSNCTFGDGCGVGSEQERWLRNEMAAHPYQCKAMFMHHPFTTSDRGNFDATVPGAPNLELYLAWKANQDGLRDIYKAFYDFEGDVALAGHSHFYERFDPQNIDREKDANGFRQIVIGTGGRYAYDVDEQNLRPLSITHSKKREKGVLRMILKQDSYSWDFVPTPGTNYQDSGEAKCHFAK